MRTRRTQSSSDPVMAANRHHSVLLHESIEQLLLAPTDTVVDATLGGAGHTREIIQHLDKRGMLIGIDADSDAVALAQQCIGDDVLPKVCLVQDNFRNVSHVLDALGVSQITKALFDLGWSSNQLISGKGFSFQEDEPLLMTYGDPEAAPVTARDIVNEWDEANIADVLYGWGGERHSRRIARAIIERRSEQAIETTKELVAVIQAAVPAWYRHKRIHPATRTFQALRIAVNDEIGALTEGITGAYDYLAPAGRLAVITFHSIEDRVVKNLFRDWQTEGRGVMPVRKIKPSEREVTENPRARSATLRVFQKN